MSEIPQDFLLLLSRHIVLKCLIIALEYFVAYCGYTYCWMFKISHFFINIYRLHCSTLFFDRISIFVVTPQPLRAVGVLFSPMVSGWAGGWREKVCPGCISDTVRCRKLILGRDIG